MSSETAVVIMPENSTSDVVHGLPESLDAYFATGKQRRSLLGWVARFMPRAGSGEGPVNILNFRMYGDRNLGREILQGTYTAAGQQVPVDNNVWQGKFNHPGMAGHLHGYTWLEDLLSLQSGPAIRLAQAIVGNWLETCGRGRGQGWKPDLTARRMIWWIRCYPLLGLDASRDFRIGIRASISRQAAALRLWRALVPSGRVRVEVESALMLAAAFLDRRDRISAQAQAIYCSQVEAWLDQIEASSAANPQDHLRMAFLLSLVRQACKRIGCEFSGHLEVLVTRLINLLSALRMSDMELCRLQQGGMTPAGLLAGTISDLDGSLQRSSGKSMKGIVAIDADDLRIVLDVSGPPEGTIGTIGSGSLSIEVSWAGVPVFTNAGPGRAFGQDISNWATSAEAYSSVVVSGQEMDNRGFWSGERPTGPARTQVRGGHVHADHGDYRFGSYASARNRRILGSRGYTLTRELWATADGLTLFGVDTVSVDEDGKGDPLYFRLQFALHPAVEVIDAGSMQHILLELPNGETWHFGVTGDLGITVADSASFDDLQHQVWKTSRLIIDGRLSDGESSCNWQLSRHGN